MIDIRESLARDLLGTPYKDLSDQKKSVIDLIADQRPTGVGPELKDQRSYWDRMADKVAQIGGSWAFILSFGAVLCVYASVNIVLGAGAWDPYPFILLNLFLSMLAAIQAPVIMMSQNRQDTKDRLRGELDYDVNRRTAAEIQGLAQKLNALSEKMGDIDESLRQLQTATLPAGR